MRRSDLRQDAIVVPQHQSHGGLNDKLAVGPPALMDAYFQQLDAVYHTPPIVRPYQAETFLQAHLHKREIAFALIYVYIYLSAEMLYYQPALLAADMLTCLQAHLQRCKVAVAQIPIPLYILRPDKTLSET
jgi:hypothetical protein